MNAVAQLIPVAILVRYGVLDLVAVLQAVLLVQLILITQYVAHASLLVHGTGGRSTATATATASGTTGRNDRAAGESQAGRKRCRRKKLAVHGNLLDQTVVLLLSASRMKPPRRGGFIV